MGKKEEDEIMKNKEREEVFKHDQETGTPERMESNDTAMGKRRRKKT